MSAQSTIPDSTIDVIVLASRYRDTAELLDCLRRQTYQPSQVILIDTSDDNAIESLAQRELSSSPIRLLTMYRPDLGTASGRNLALSLSTSAFVATLDDDLLVANDYMEQATRFLLEPLHRDVAAITLIGPYQGVARKNDAATEKPKKLIRRLGKILFLSDSLQSGRVLPTGFRSELGDETRPVQWVQGCNAVWRREVLTAYKYDEALERYPYALSEDIELSARVSRDYRMFVVAASGVHHKASPGRRLDPEQFGESLVRNHRYISRKLWPGWHNRVLFGWCLTGILLSAISRHAVQRTVASHRYVRGVLRAVTSA